MGTRKRNLQAQSREFWDRKAKVLAFAGTAFFITLMSVFPLYLKNKYYEMTGHKAEFFWLITGIATGLIAISWLIFKLSEGGYLKPVIKVKNHVLLAEWALLAFTILSFISAVMSQYREIVWVGWPERAEGFWTFLCYALSFAIVARFFEPKRVHMLIFAASAIIVALIGIGQFVEFDPFELFPYVGHKDFTDANGNPTEFGLKVVFRTTLGNIDIVSAYVSIVIIFFAVLYSTEKSWWRLVYLAASVLNFLLLFISDTDAGRVGLLGAAVVLIPYLMTSRERLGRMLVTSSGWILVYAWYKWYFNYQKDLEVSHPSENPNRAMFLNNMGYTEIWPYMVLFVVLLAAGLALLYLFKKLEFNEKLMKRIGAITLAVVIVGGAAGVFVVGPRFSDNKDNIIYQASQMMRGKMEYNYGNGRGWVWSAAISRLDEHPFIGFGPDTFYYGLGQELQNQSGFLMNVNFDKAHNTYIQIALTLGLPALAAYLLFLGSLLVPAAKRAFNNPIILAAGAGAVGYAVQGIFGVDVPIATPLFWGVLGIIGGELIRERKAAELEKLTPVEEEPVQPQKQQGKRNAKSRA